MKRTDKTIQFQVHAVARMKQRSCSKEQIRATVRTGSERPNPRREGSKIFEKSFSKKRRLAVIAEENDSEIWVITAFWR